MIKPLIDSHLDFIYQGKAMESCIWPRVKNTLNRAHRQRGGESDLDVDLKCPPWHDAVKNNYLRAVKDLEQTLRTRQLVSNGPHEWLTHQYPVDLMNLVLEAHNQRNAIWSTYSINRNALKVDDQLDQYQKAAAKGILLERARRKEQEVTVKCWSDASQLPDYTPGSFMGAWVQLAVSSLKRFESERAKQDPINLKALMHLPEEERYAYATNGAVRPTMAIRAIEPLPEEATGKRTTVLAKGKTHVLADEDGNTIVHLAPRAQKYAGRQFTILGTVPEVDDTSKQWQQCPNLLVLQLH